MIHQKIIASIESCTNEMHLKTCFNFLDLPEVKDCHLKEKLVRSLIKSKAIKLNVDLNNSIIQTHY